MPCQHHCITRLGCLNTLSSASQAIKGLLMQKMNCSPLEFLEGAAAICSKLFQPSHWLGPLIAFSEHYVMLHHIILVAPIKQQKSETQKTLYVTKDTHVPFSKEMLLPHQKHLALYLLLPSHFLQNVPFYFSHIRHSHFYIYFKYLRKPSYLS